MRRNRWPKVIGNVPGTTTSAPAKPPARCSGAVVSTATTSSPVSRWRRTSSARSSPRSWWRGQAVRAARSANGTGGRPVSRKSHRPAVSRCPWSRAWSGISRTSSGSATSRAARSASKRPRRLPMPAAASVRAVRNACSGSGWAAELHPCNGTSGRPRASTAGTSATGTRCSKVIEQADTSYPRRRTNSASTGMRRSRAESRSSRGAASLAHQVIRNASRSAISSRPWKTASSRHPPSAQPLEHS
ncbi:hypothetical protein ADK67_04555 [Saccharothrix sp. NRRL B-16348]|nr:hypothetical protein [Saccharothrix sp. NRRL B-16348]KOX34209.1 hypothetical protein ADK67_04555 [Saccharothrix sp. NRRL B-16348]